MKTSTPTIILELPLKTTSEEEVIILKRLDAGRQLYNACLGELLNRLNLMKQSKEYQRAVRLPVGKRGSKAQKVRTNAFYVLNDKFKFREYDISAFATRKIRDSWIREHVNSALAQTISKRAFRAVQKKSFGIAKRVRFKGKNQFDSMEGKSTDNGLIFRDGNLNWANLRLPVIIDPKNKYQEHGLKQKLKYCRIIRRKINGKNRFYVQLVLKGIPHQNPKHPIGTEIVGLDLGPSTIAYVGDTTAELKQFCEEIIPDWKTTRRLQRKMSRSRRATNPDNYNENGTYKEKSKEKKKGKKIVWRKSTRYKKLQKEYAETNRKLAEYRKSLHGKMANDIIAVGNKIQTEKISYRAWQKLWGKSIRIRAPSMIVSMIRRKAENAHGYLQEIPTNTTKLSQTCHKCEAQVKKTLNQRWQKCCGIKMQKDLYSAFLAKCCVINKDGKQSLDRTIANALWSGLEPVLNDALLRVVARSHQSAISGNSVPASFGLARSQSGCIVKPGITITEVTDVVVRNEDESCEKVMVTTGTSRFKLRGGSILGSHAVSNL
jgi:hypothetical protein